MYEENTQSTPRRLLGLALLFITVVALLWVFAWLLFFRHDNTKKVTTPSRPTTQQQSGTQKSKTNSSGNSSTTPNGTAVVPAPAGGATNQNANGSTNSSAQPSALANTGAGDVVLPVVIAVIVGGTLYQVRLRRPEN